VVAKSRLLEVLGIVMIGEGVLAAVDPRGHTLLWRHGPRAWEAMWDPFVRRPTLTRCVGVAEAALGYWLAARQMSSAERS
jgi:hypothetical protein